MSDLSPGLHPSDVVNPHNHGAIVTVAAAFGTTISLVFLCGRLGVRWPWRGCCGADDAAAVAASVFSIVQMVVMIEAVHEGFGKRPGELTGAELSTVDKYLYAANLLFITTLYLAKFSVVLLLRRLSGSVKQMKTVSYMLISCCFLWMITFLIIATPSGSVNPWLQVEGPDGNIFPRWIVMEIMSSALDVAIVVYVVHLVWNMQTRRDTKRLVVFLFAIRLPIIAIAILRVCSMYKSIHGSAPNFTYVTTEVFLQAEMCYSIVSATTPVLRIFLRAARTGVHGTVAHGSFADTLGTGSATGRGRSYLNSSKPHSTLVYSSHAAPSPRQLDVQYGIELGDRNNGETTTTAMAASDKTSVTSDTSETAIVVRQKVDVSYDVP